jgi:S-adenosylmethionine:tRNA ribosyltransferase-isomerase
MSPGDLLVLNATRVIPARLSGRKIPGGGRIEILLIRRLDEITWEVLVKGKGLIVGKCVLIDEGPEGKIVTMLSGPRRLVRFDKPLEPFINRIGQVPLPPYIRNPISDPSRYQTIYAQNPGSVAAPTAGLHFTEKLLNQIKARGIGILYVTLHIGLDTFGPVRVTDPFQHKIHSEWCQISGEVASKVNETKLSGGRVFGVGTTSVRTLETAANYADEGNVVGVFEGPTNLFILPGYNFKVVDVMVTNFHLPKSTLLMMVSAFAGRKQILNTYQIAKKEGYRFYSFGDAMLIL